MISYVPFLKSKQNEINSLSVLDSEIKPRLAPFFDYPKRDDETEEKFVENTRKLIKSIERHLGGFFEFYFDTYDIDDSFQVDGKNVYKYLLEKMGGMPVIPVVSIDRSSGHMDSVYDLKSNDIINKNSVAFRITPEDFHSFSAVKEEIKEELNDVFDLFENIDLIFDCRLCVNLNVDVVAADIVRFAQNFCSMYPVRRLVVSGSSIPASVSDILNSNSERHLERQEINIYKAVERLPRDLSFVFGDYATVSPGYSDADIPPEQMQNRITAKLVYSYNNCHFFMRGGSLTTRGHAQYFSLAANLCGQYFYRGQDYSWGDKYFEEKSRSVGNYCTPSSIIKPSVNSHITYMALNPV